MIKNQDFTTIGKNSVITGNLNFSGATHIMGKVSGEITVEREASLIISVGAFVEGNINCHHLEVYGQFSGEIKSQGKVTLYPTAEITGKIIAKNLEILPGAVVNMNGHTEESI